MRILAIRGQNLASLAREFSVELARGDLANVGLFAITGPVGAGKSTLLDALCLALFDRTPRLSGRGGASIGDEGQDPGDWLRANDPRTLLRRDAIDGYAEVDFLGRDGIAYRSRWSVRRARRKPDGRLQDQELDLSDLARDQVIASGRRTEVLAAIRQRLGLDFAQFCRSVLLAQGEFHAFLHAAADERAKLLETLTGASVYRRLSRAAHEKRRDGEKEAAVLRAQFDSCEVLLEGARKALEAEIARLDKQLDVCNVGIKLAQRYVLWHQAAEQHRQAESEATVALQEAQQANARAESRRRDLQVRNRAMQVLPRWEVAQQARAQALEAAQRVDDEGARHEGALRDVESRRAALRALLVQRFGDAVADDVPAIVRELPQQQAALQRWQEAERVAAESARQLPAQLQGLAEHEQRLASLRSESVQLEAARLVAAEALDRIEREAAGGDFEQLAGRRKQLADELRHLHAVAEPAAAWRRAEQAAADATGRLAALRVECHQQHASRDEIVRRAADGAQALAAARARSRQAEQLHGLAALRSELVEGEACPLCGSHDHPAAAEHDAADLAAVWELVADAERIHEQAQRELANATARAQRLDREVSVAEAESATAGARLQEAQGDCAHLAVATAAGAQESVREQQLQLDAAERELSGAEEQARLRARHLQEAKLAARQREQAQRAHAVNVASAEKALSGVRDEVRQQQQQAERQLAVLDELRRGLAPACTGLSGGVEALEAMGRLRLAGLQAMHQSHVEHQSSLHLAALAQDSLAQAKRQFEQAHAAEQRAEQALATALSVSEVVEDDVAIAHRLGADGLADEEAALRQLSDTVTRWRTVLQERAARRRQHEDLEERPTLDADDAQVALADAQQARQSVDKQRVQARARMTVDDQMQQNRSKLLPRLEQAEKELGIWRTLAELIGSSAGDAFAVFAQGLTLDLLLLEANRRLEELARRYRLEKSHGGELDFVVVDLDMGGTRRSLHTLSGGETFLVSLALALALATMAAPRSRVETLFLDEGFGTLDAANLEIAIGALDSLQATGCQVGVISHVDGIAERIGAVVEVQPEGSGQSRVFARVQ